MRERLGSVLRIRTERLEPVEPQVVCLITNRRFDTTQVVVPVNNNAAYVYCQMNVRTLNADSTSRYATDPEIQVRVNKTDAVLWVELDDTV